MAGQLRSVLGDRNNTLVCSFIKDSPRVSAIDIHEWIHDKLRLREQDVTLVQIDGIRGQVTVKVSDTEILETLIDTTKGTVSYERDEGMVSHMRIAMAGLGRRVRIANLPPEMSKTLITECIGHYGEVLDIQEEKWSGAYRYKVCNGILNVMVNLKRHIPSHLTLAGHRALIDYEGQPKNVLRV